MREFFETFLVISGCYFLKETSFCYNTCTLLTTEFVIQLGPFLYCWRLVIKRPKVPLYCMHCVQIPGASSVLLLSPISHEPGKISTKRGSRGAKLVTFTPQKARELREKLRGTDSFHDFMYHSAIASRLANHDWWSYPSLPYMYRAHYVLVLMLVCASLCAHACTCVLRHWFIE